MLHDIISMSNNLVDHDAYIIIGVDKSGFKINDARNDLNRRSTQKIVDFLKDKKFAGGSRPTVKVEEVLVYKVCLDVIIIKNSNNTPFYLDEQYMNMKVNYIYSRIQNTNTPINCSADITVVEQLWKKRAFLTKSSKDRFFEYLNDFENWENSSS